MDATTQAEIDEIQITTGEPVTFAGGGKGQIARVQWGTITIEAKSTTRPGAVHDLRLAVEAEALNAIDAAIEQAEEAGETDIDDEIDRRAEIAAGVEPDDRVSIEDALASMRTLWPDLEVYEEDPEADVKPGPIWKGTTLVRIVPCVGECMGSVSTLCNCRCDGNNHGIGSAGFAALWDAANTVEQRSAAILAMTPVRMGENQCQCGCGGITARRFVPGHDARYHARIKREQQARDRGISVEQVPAAIAAERRARAKARKEATVE